MATTRGLLSPAMDMLQPTILMEASATLTEALKGLVKGQQSQDQTMGIMDMALQVLE